MTRSEAVTVDDFIQRLPEDRREVMAALIKVIRKHMPKGYRESMGWGMPSWEIPLETYPDTYNGKPLGYVALAPQKNNYSLYLTGAYMDPGQTKALQDAFAAAGRKLDMGKSCLRFRKLDDLPLEAIGRVIASMPPADYIALYEKNRKR